MKTCLPCFVLLLSLPLTGCFLANLPYHNYEQPDSSVVFGGSPSVDRGPTSNDEIAVAFEGVDGREITPITSRGIDVSPGRHGLTVQMLSQLYYVSVDVAPYHCYELKGNRKDIDELSVQVWDVTQGFDKEIMLKEIQLHETKPSKPFTRTVFGDPNSNDVTRFERPYGDPVIRERTQMNDERRFYDK